MEPTEKARFDSLYQTHLRALKLRGFSESTSDAYARADRRVSSPITTAFYAQLTPTTDQGRSPSSIGQ